MSVVLVSLLACGSGKGDGAAMSSQPGLTSSHDSVPVEDDCPPPPSCAGCAFDVDAHACLFPAPPVPEQSPMERSLYVGAIETLLRGNGVRPTQVVLTEAKLAIVVKSAQVDKARACLTCVLPVSSFSIEKDQSRGPSAVREFHAGNVRQEYVTAGGELKLPEIWAAVVNSFPSSCGREFDPALRGARKERTAQFEIPSRRRGLRFKGQIYMALTPADPSESGSASLSVDGNFAWRRASDERWQRIEASNVADPKDFGASAADAVSQCATRLANEILNAP